jgi:hypothetical protein
MPSGLHCVKCAGPRLWLEGERLSLARCTNVGIAFVLSIDFGVVNASEGLDERLQKSHSDWLQASPMYGSLVGRARDSQPLPRLGYSQIAVAGDSEY